MAAKKKSIPPHLKKCVGCRKRPIGRGRSNRLYCSECKPGRKSNIEAAARYRAKLKKAAAKTAPKKKAVKKTARRK